MTDNYMTVAEASEYLGVAKQTVRDWIKEGRFSEVQQGVGETSPFRISRQEVIDFKMEVERKRSLRQ